MKLCLLDFGSLIADLGWVLEAAGVSTHSNPSPETLRRDFQMIGALIDHPKHGVILYDVGPAPNWEELWPDPVKEVFGITRYEEENRLDKQLQKAGYGLKDVSAIIISHMHLDHAGGLEFFRGNGYSNLCPRGGNKVCFLCDCYQTRFWSLPSSLLRYIIQLESGSWGRI